MNGGWAFLIFLWLVVTLYGCSGKPVFLGGETACYVLNRGAFLACEARR
jgi:hypothetical protein